MIEVLIRTSENLTLDSVVAFNDREWKGLMGVVMQKVLRLEHADKLVVSFVGGGKVVSASLMVDVFIGLSFNDFRKILVSLKEGV